MFVFFRLLMAVPVVLVVATVVFTLARLTGDPATLLAGDMATPREIAQVRASLGLDKPLVQQFFIWIGDVLSGDLGRSIQSKKPVVEMIGARLEPTLFLAVSALFVAVSVAVPLGVVAAWKRDSWTDRALMLFSVAGFSIPTFVVGYILILAFSLWLGLFPVQGYVSPTTNFLQALRHIALPSVTLAVFYIALIARVARASVLNVMNEEFIQTARAKGVPERRVLGSHVLRNAAVPIVTVIGVSFASLISGVVVTESVFNIPGLGRLTTDVILQRDYPVMQGIILFFSLMYVAVNLVVDLVYAIIDPRIRA